MFEVLLEPAERLYAVLTGGHAAGLQGQTSHSDTKMITLSYMQQLYFSVKGFQENIP